jgi:lon-related putative ATP-dependent protease
MNRKINELSYEDLQITIDFPENHEIDEDGRGWGIIGQPRALKALKMGIEIKAKGYNLFITGDPGTGRKTATMQVLKDHCRKVSPLKDIAYVYNFKKIENPKVLYFPEGTSSKFKKDMKKLVGKVKEIIVKNLSKDSYKSGRDRMITDIEKQENRILSAFEDELVNNGFRTIQVPDEDKEEPVTDLIPLYNKEAVTFEELQTFVAAGTITEDEWQQTREKYYHFMDEMKNIFTSIKKMRDEMEESLSKAAEDAVRRGITAAIRKLKNTWKEEEICAYLSEVEKDFIQHHNILVDESMTDEIGEMIADRYDVNIIVEHNEESQLPTITENHPTDVNLFGNIETTLDLSGESSTSFMMIRAGSMIQASGGFLILQAEDILKTEEIWNSLKRVLQTGQVEIRGQQSPLGIPVTNLKPEPVNVDTKVIIIGSSDLYFSMSQIDSDFIKHFKVSVEFDSDMIRNSSTTGQYVVFIRNLIKKESLKEIDDQGILEICKHGIKLAERRDRLSTKFSDISDLLREADYWASMDNKSIIDRDCILRAINEKIYILNLPEEKLNDQIRRGVVLIKSEGSIIGSINGLVVMDRGYHSFGLPVRITASAGPGRKGLINIEKESGLSGNIHDKGMFILEGFLRKRFGSDYPLSFTSSICMEQSYTGVDGDSASAAELFALVSELGEIPLRQDIAVTGSINQFGEIQPVGGVSEKIEGFFSICEKKGLSGTQGVLIPEINKNNLILSKKILKNIKEGSFHLYTMTMVDEGLSLLTGLDSETINQVIDKKLKNLSRQSLDRHKLP